jgi:hypothetical protein
MVLTPEELHELWIVAREACGDSWSVPISTALEAAGSAGSAA